jgi:hypothetical protein
MIVGLKYVGASDDLPAHIPIGDVVKLRREPREQSDPGAVAAFYKGTKVGYLSSDKQPLWDSLRPSARRRAKVTGEILDEEGNLAGLDIEIDGTRDPDRQSPAIDDALGKTSKRGGGRKVAVGLAVLFLTSTALSESIGDPVPALSSITPDPLALVDRSPTNRAELIQYRSGSLRFARVLPNASDRLSSIIDGQPSLTPEEGADSSQQMQAQELSRMVQQANAHRLTMEMKRRAELALLLHQAEMQKTRQLAEDLRQAQEAVARQRVRLQELERRAQETADWQAENDTLKDDIAQLQRRIEQMMLVAQQRVEEERSEVALKELNQEELVQHKHQMAAWRLVARVPAAQQTKKTRSAIRQAPTEQASTTLAVPADKPNKKQKKTNFSRYVQENRELDLSR